MSKRSIFTTISPLPPGMSRQVVLDFLHDHEEMINLNPLIKEHHQIEPPSHALPDELECIWYSLTDRISYLPGGLAEGSVTYTCAFHDLPTGIQTHCYAPAGLDIQEKWTLNGSLPGEPVEPVELGTGAPLTGLYLREDVDMRCNVIMTSFVKKTLKKSHAGLVERLKAKAQALTAASPPPPSLPASPPTNPRTGGHKPTLSTDKPLPYIPTSARQQSSVYFPPQPAQSDRSYSPARPQPYQQAQHTPPPAYPSFQAHTPPDADPPAPTNHVYSPSQRPSDHLESFASWNRNSEAYRQALRANRNAKHNRDA